MKLTMDQMARELAADLSIHLDYKISQRMAKSVIGSVFEYVAGSLAEGHEINVPGFGKFKVNDKPEREVRNPKTGEMTTVAAKRALKFTAAKALKEKVGG